MADFWTKIAIASAIGLWQIAGPAWAQAGLTEIEDFEYWQSLCSLQVAAAQEILSEATETAPAKAAYEMALVACERSIALRPEDAAMWAIHREILLNLERYPDAIASAQKVLSLDPQNALALTYQ